MEYWPSVQWKAVVSSFNYPDEIVELQSPFALIGSHRLCDIRIKRRPVPPVAYIAFSFQDSIEVWPLCALAYSQWGVLYPDQVLRVGRKQIQLLQSDTNDQLGFQQSQDEGTTAVDRASLDAPAILGVDLRGKGGSLVLNRRVVILGSDHPSTRRLHGVGFAPCERAIVSLQQKSWLINLNPKRERSVHDLVKLLSERDPETKLGKLNVSFRLPSPNELRTQAKPQVTDSLVSSSHRPGQPAGVSTQYIASEPDPSVEPKNRIVAKTLDPADSDVELESMDDMTSVVTDRLVSIHQARWWQQRTIKIAMFSTIFLAASVALFWIVTRLVLPIVIDLQGW